MERKYANLSGRVALRPDVNLIPMGGTLLVNPTRFSAGVGGEIEMTNMENSEEEIVRIPDDPFDNVFEDDLGRFLRLTGQSGEHLVMFLDEPTKEVNPNYPKEEYHWPVQLVPDPNAPGVHEERIITESSKSFCTAVKKLRDNGGYLNDLIWIRWHKEERKGKQVKIWNLVRMDSHVAGERKDSH